MTVVFPKSEKRTHWEKIFNEVKQKITAAHDYQPIPEFIGDKRKTIHIFFSTLLPISLLLLHKLIMHKNQLFFFSFAIQIKYQFVKLVLDYSLHVPLQH